MKYFLHLLTITSALALPPLEEAREVLGSQETERREALTQEIWKAGREAIPLLTKLSLEENPEVFRRALFVLQRLRMGLEPDSPPDLLKLAEAVNLAKPEFRATKLGELLDHPEGVRPALVFLDSWAADRRMPAGHIFNLAEIVTQAILERRSSWKDFLSADLSPRCRGTIIAALSWEDLPMKSRMIANLAKRETKDVFEMAVTCPNQIATEAYIEMARIATVNGDVPLAVRILASGLHQDTTYDLARAIAFLEVAGEIPPIQYEGNWINELDLFRARAHQNPEKILQISSGPNVSPVLAYESNLIAGSLTLPSNDDGIDFPASTSLAAIHRFFGVPPGEPDIEALTSSVLIDWSELARTLMSLACPAEAAEKLSSEGQVITATGLLWRSNQRDKALSLAEDVLGGPDETLETRMRLTLASLHFDAGDREQARMVFERLITTGIQQDTRLQGALKLGLNFFSREELLPLASSLMADQAYQRAVSIAGMLPYHPKVSTFWYEYFREPDPAQSPLVILKKVEDFLSNQAEEARLIIENKIAESTKARLLPTDDLYQLALFLKVPGALEIVETAAWFQLSIDDLLSIIRDDTWDLAIRKRALSTALSIDPANVLLHWFNRELNQVEIPVELHLPTLANPGLALQLAALTGKRETIDLTSELADLSNHQAVRCLATLGQSYLKDNQTAKAGRLLQAAICGEIATGPQPATPIQSSLDTFANYFEARKSISADPEEAAIWTERLTRIGRN